MKKYTFELSNLSFNSVDSSTISSIGGHTQLVLFPSNGSGQILATGESSNVFIPSKVTVNTTTSCLEEKNDYFPHFINAYLSHHIEDQNNYLSHYIEHQYATSTERKITLSTGGTFDFYSYPHEWPDNAPTGCIEGLPCYFVETHSVLAIKKYRLQQKISKNLSVSLSHLRAVKVEGQFDGISRSENKALSLLKQILSTEKEWRKYLVHGFIAVRGKSGLIYKIERGKSHIGVYNMGCKIAELCVNFKFGIPPTDSVIAGKVLIEANETDIWRKANIYGRAVGNSIVNGWGRRRSVTEEDLCQVVMENSCGRKN